jgi:hypothetical protein
VLGIPDVTVCKMLSLLVHVTVVPTLILIGFGENALLPRVAVHLLLKLCLYYWRRKKKVIVVDDDGCCAKQDTGHIKDAPIAVVMIKITTRKLGFFISAV